jgi:hypothetical protein
MQSAGVNLQIDEVEKCNSSSSRRHKALHNTAFVLPKQDMAEHTM